MGVEVKQRIEKMVLWGEIAKEDLIISKLLYENKHYTYSIYTLQQAIEKCVKSMMILNNVKGVKN